MAGAPEAGSCARSGANARPRAEALRGHAAADRPLDAGRCRDAGRPLAAGRCHAAGRSWTPRRPLTSLADRPPASALPLVPAAADARPTEWEAPPAAAAGFLPTRVHPPKTASRIVTSIRARAPASSAAPNPSPARKHRGSSPAAPAQPATGRTAKAAGAEPTTPAAGRPAAGDARGSARAPAGGCLWGNRRPAAAGSRSSPPGMRRCASAARRADPGRATPGRQGAEGHRRRCVEQAAAEPSSARPTGPARHPRGRLQQAQDGRRASGWVRTTARRRASPADRALPAPRSASMRSQGARDLASGRPSSAPGQEPEASAGRRAPRRRPACPSSPRGEEHRSAMPSCRESDRRAKDRAAVPADARRAMAELRCCAALKATDRPRSRRASSPLTRPSI